MLGGLCQLPGPLLALSKQKPTLIAADHSKNNLSWAVCSQVPPPLTPSDGFYRGLYGCHCVDRGWADPP